MKAGGWIIDRSEGRLFLHGADVAIELKHFDPGRVLTDAGQYEGNSYRSWAYEMPGATLLLSINDESHYLALNGEGWQAIAEIRLTVLGPQPKIGACMRLSVTIGTQEEKA
jgi:hypothetical protein